MSSEQECPQCGGSGTVQVTIVITSTGDGKSYSGLGTQTCGGCNGRGTR
ncbi:hypothetical protein [Streptomyces sp. NPDC049879]